jgi:hypothetical protein
MTKGLLQLLKFVGIVIGLSIVVLVCDKFLAVSATIAVLVAIVIICWGLTVLKIRTNRHPHD